MYNKDCDYKRELTEEDRLERLERMINKWKKTSKENIREAEKQHTKRDARKKKKLNAEQRKIRNGRKNS